MHDRMIMCVQHSESVGVLVVAGTGVKEGFEVFCFRVLFSPGESACSLYRIVTATVADGLLALCRFRARIH